LPRHRTLRAVIDWSWELLSGAERTVLRRLSVFSGGASLEAAERVCAGDAVEPGQVLELLTSLAEKSLVRTEGDGAPRYRMLGTIKQYAEDRLAEAGESEAVRLAHLAYFTDLAETAEPHLRRAEQMEWLATLHAEHDNIGAAMRGALAAGQADAAMRLAAGAGWYWWLSGQKTEGMELVSAAAGTPGEVSDDIRATVSALVVLFLNSGPGDERQAAEWIHEAYRLSRRSRSRHPGMALVVPLERMLQAPGAVLAAWEPLLEDEDPWVRALARLQLGKMRILLGQAGPAADAYLTGALAEFRSIGERFGISFALTELAERIATRGDLAGACEHYEEAVQVVVQVGAIDDVIWMRARQAQLSWLLGDRAAGVAAIADAQRCAERVTWPAALAVLALARAELARWSGRTEEAYQQLDVATTLLGDEAGAASIRAVTQDLLGYLTNDVEESRKYRAAARQAAAEAGHAPVIARMLVGIAELASRRDDHAQAARLLGASAAVRGLWDRADPDLARIEPAARNRLGGERFAEAVRDGESRSWSDLAEVTLAS
jgi:hypothetical protein